MGKTKELPKDVRDKIVDVYKAGMGYKAISSWVHSLQKNIGYTLRRNGLKPCSVRQVPLLKKAHVQVRLKFANEHINAPRETGRRCCGQMRPKLSTLASTQLDIFEERKIQNMTLRTPSPPSSMVVEALCFWGGHRPT
ncbi:hypothetical protein NFI96_012566 [Prochilodus magdalenae]|nr:hypothetical protein NFI96_012566 [Prochilodus magdalenae]